jgi:hypothetical protein
VREVGDLDAAQKLDPTVGDPADGPVHRVADAPRQGAPGAELGPLGGDAGARLGERVSSTQAAEQASGAVGEAGRPGVGRKRRGRVQGQRELVSGARAAVA